MAVLEKGEQFDIYCLDIIMPGFTGIALAKDNTELQSKINEALKKLKENGEYDKIYAKWFGGQK